MNTASIILLISGLVAARFSNPQKIGVVAMVLLFLLILFFTVIFLIADNLTGNGFDESVFYHLQFGIAGAGIKDFYRTIFIFLALMSASIFFGYLLYRYLKRDHVKGKDSRWLRPFPIALLLGSLWIHPLTQDMGTAFVTPKIQDVLRNNQIPVLNELLADQPEALSGIRDFSAIYQDLLLDEVLVNPPNIVYIYLESLERTYMDESIFPGLTKELHILEDSALSFIDIDQAWGTGWTVAGMTASQCTIPLVTTGSGVNTMHGMEEFYPKATCLGDILENQGFTLSYMGGAHLTFAGKGKFYSTHGFERVRGREELKGALKDQRYRNSWGLYDDTLFDLAWEEFLSLSNHKERFGLFLLTLDTHQPDGYPSSSCKDIIYHEKTTPC